MIQIKNYRIALTVINTLLFRQKNQIISCVSLCDVFFALRIDLLCFCKAYLGLYNVILTQTSSLADLHRLIKDKNTLQIQAKYYLIFDKKATL